MCFIRMYIFIKLHVDNFEITNQDVVRNMSAHSTCLPSASIASWCSVRLLYSETDVLKQHLVGQ